MSVDLERIGWNRHFEMLFKPFTADGLAPARVTREDRGAYLVLHNEGEGAARVTGRFLHAARTRSDFPAVGDWVALDVGSKSQDGRIHALLPRRTSFSRRMPGSQTDEQIIAANVDTAFVVCGLDGDFNLRRIERYLAAAYNSGATRAIVLNKMDVCSDPEGMAATVRSVAEGVPVFPVSAVCGWGLEALDAYLAPGQTVALLGSSGVGKSSLINCWLDDCRLPVQPVREDDSHGRHTTTHRELICLPQGGVVIDTPGMRELGMWADDGGLLSSFPEIDALAKECRFRDCRHEQEPGCAVKEAMERGLLSAERLESYHKLQRELRHMEQRQADKERMAHRSARRGKSRSKRQLLEDGG